VSQRAEQTRIAFPDELSVDDGSLAAIGTVIARLRPEESPHTDGRLNLSPDHLAAAGSLIGGPEVMPAPGAFRDSLEGQLCGLFAVDIAGFSSADRDDDIQIYVHTALYAMLRTAFDRSDIPWADCAYEDRGDGVLVIVPPTLSAVGLVDPIPERLRALVRRHNRVSADAARIQLRVAAHIGSVQYDGYGFVGHDVTLLCRLLDARPLKRLLAESGAEVAFIASKYLYDNVIRSRPSLVDPEVFKPMPVRVKETRTRAWAYTLGASPAA
jgi:hypothetical protein